MEKISQFWLDMFLYTGWTLTGIAVINQLIYAAMLKGKSTRSAKYGYATSTETRSLRRTSVFLAFGIAFFAFYLIAGWVGVTNTYHIVFIAFFSIMISVAIGYGLYAYIQYYYPFMLEKRLVRIRFKPMVSPKTGIKMRLLNEDQEDVHLTKEMIEEEDNLSVDYDVWLDETSGFKVIEKYDTHYHSLVCENCNFRTLIEQNEELVTEPTEEIPGLLIRHYKCSYCGHPHHRKERLPSLKEEKAL